MDSVLVVKPLALPGVLGTLATTSPRERASAS
jgi:hypothetical protein